MITWAEQCAAEVPEGNTCDDCCHAHVCRCLLFNEPLSWRKNKHCISNDYLEGTRRMIKSAEGEG